jgi:hypothetical protein
VVTSRRSLSTVGRTLLALEVGAVSAEAADVAALGSDLRTLGREAGAGATTRGKVNFAAGEDSIGCAATAAAGAPVDTDAGGGVPVVDASGRT